MKDSLLKVENLSIVINNSKILDDVTFSVPKNSICALLCPNNCGKTTLIKAISGIIVSNSGKISVNEIPLSKEKINDYILNISTILEDIDDQFIFSKVDDEIFFPLINLNYKKEDIEEIIKSISHITKISTILGKKVRNLSYFEKVKVLIAASIVHKPKLLLIDDVFRFLNNDEKSELHKIFKKISKELEISILFTTSEIDDVINLENIILLNNGKVVDISNYQNLIMKDNELTKMGFHIPIMIDLSRKLQFYNLIDEIYYDEDKVVDKLWN